MSEHEPVVDFFSQSASLIDNVCALQRTLVEGVFDKLREGNAHETAVDTATECCRNLYDGVANNPVKVIEHQLQFWQSQLQLSNNFLAKFVGEQVEPVVRPKPEDRRFSSPEWDRDILFDFIKQSYLLTAEHTLNCLSDLDGLEERDRDRLMYFVRQILNALAPTNFALTNPEVLYKTLATKGENLVEGLRMMAEDRKKSADILNICMSKPNAFEVGKNIANTPGHVVAENELMQLIQYSPTTPQVRRTPVLIVPSWVNKYYILDLSPKNSYIRWLVEQGHTVFAISWVNPGANLRATHFADYMQKGPLAAINAIERLTGEKQVSAVGYCLGGILLAATLAYTDTGDERRFASATYLAASVDFKNSGDIGMFIDEQTIEATERQMQRHGYLDGRLLASGFNLLKENELYWNYYVTNYLKGERPVAFDLLHWNSDSTNVPEAAHRFILRELHLKNGLLTPGAITLHGRGIDLGAITTPTYVLGTDKDHIARWQSCYSATQLQSGETRFVLAGSGHIAGVINHPQANKYYHFINAETPLDANDWLSDASKIEGSWWLDWLAWQQQMAGPLVEARHIDVAAAIEPAPGRYVKQRLDDQQPLSQRDAA